MKNLLALIFVSSMLTGCNNNKTEKPQDDVSYTSFGAVISPDKAVEKTELAKIYANLKEGDTVSIKFKSEILDVCQKKGCWMNMDLDDENEVFVKFTDYGFFVPKNAAKQDGIVDGKAFVSITTVDELKHYAQDAGKSKKEIDEITEPEITYSFLADGVLIEDFASNKKPK